jgi:Lar family restriction alleviation protein
MKAALNACPFCGSRTIQVHDISADRHHKFFAAECRSCEAEGPIARTAKLAAEAWNTRKPPSPDGGPHEEHGAHCPS